DQRTVDMRPTFDGENVEPVVLPARYPNLLANGSSGIAVGMATNIPPHNIGELVKACIKLIDQPDCATADLVGLHRGPIRGPDFPLGGRMIIDQKALRAIYETGQGSIRVQGEWKVERPKPAKGAKTAPPPQIIISSIPYGVDKGKMLAEMGEIIAQRKLPMVANMVDESSLDNGMRIVVELVEGADAEAVMAYFFKHTDLQSNFACNFTCLIPSGPNAPQEDLQPKRIGVVEMLNQFLQFRLATVRRRFEFLLDQLRRRIHILEGFRIIFDALDLALQLIRQSNGRSDAALKLRGAFPLDEEQSLAIVDLNLYRIGQLEMKKIMDELREKQREAARIEGILASEVRLWGEIRRELTEFSEKYTDPRRTRIADETDTPEFDPEAYIVRENTNVVLTKGGWIKRVGRLQSVETTRVREGDEVLAVLPGSTHDFIAFFTSDGFAYTMRVDAVPASSGYGEPIGKFFRLRDGVAVVGAFTTDPRFTPDGALLPPRRAMYFPDANGEWQIVAATAQGQVLRTPLAPYATESTKAGRRFARLDEGDSVVFVGVPNVDHETIFLAADDGHVIHFPIGEINVLSGAGKGVRGIKLEGKAVCLGAYMLSGYRECLRLVSPGRKEPIECRRGKYPTTSRGGCGYEVVKRGSLSQMLPDPIDLVDWSQVGEPKDE
ncbi:MAG: DNA gyrase subunit A, partial [Planctomycetia bacterium]